MRERSKIKVHYGLNQTMYEGIQVTDIKDKIIDVPTSYTQQYDCALVPLMNLTPAAGALLKYLVSIMSNSNEITFVRKEKEDYIDFLKKNGAMFNPTLASINNCINELKKADFIRTVYRGSYYVNPIFFTKGVSKSARLEMVKLEYNRLFHESPDLFGPEI